jgi:hypothetical protein
VPVSPQSILRNPLRYPREKMVPEYRVWVSTGLTIAAAALVFLVALGSGRSLGAVSPTRNGPSSGLVAGDLFVVLLGVFFVGVCLLAYVLLTGIRWPRFSPEADDQPRPIMPWWMKLLAGFFPVAAAGGVVAAILAGKGHQPVNPAGALPAAPILPFGGLRVPTQGPAHFVVHWWFLGALAALGVAAFCLVVFLRRRRRGGAQPEVRPTERDGLRLAVQASLEELENDHDPRRAVIQAYARMERVLSGHGLARGLSETPLEYLTRCLPALRVSRSAAEALTSLYERARFSLHAFDHQMRQEAVAALVALRRELEDGAA